MLIENPPLNEDGVRLMMSSMGRKPSEVQVQQVLRQIRAAAKQADKDGKKKKNKKNEILCYPAKYHS